MILIYAQIQQILIKLHYARCYDKSWSYNDEPNRHVPYLHKAYSQGSRRARFYTYAHTHTLQNFKVLWEHLVEVLLNFFEEVGERLGKIEIWMVNRMSRGQGKGYGRCNLQCLWEGPNPPNPILINSIILAPKMFCWCQCFLLSLHIQVLRIPDYPCPKTLRCSPDTESSDTFLL